MFITTSSHILSLAEDHVYNLRKIGSAGDNSWLDSRRGEAFDRKLQVKLIKNQLEVLFEGGSIGYIGLGNTAQVKKLLDLVQHWNLHISPTDLNTIKTTELIREWPRLLVKKELRIKSVTFNCAGLLGDLALCRELWCKLFDSESDATQDDIIIIGFQESDNLNRSVKANASTLQRCLELSKAYLHHSHTLVSTVQLLGLMTLLFVRQSLAPHVSNVTTDTSSTGFLRVWGNKGAVLIRFNLFRGEIVGGGLELSIVNCHLSAGEGVTQIGRRRWELREIGHSFRISGLAPENAETDEDHQSWDHSFDLECDGTDSVSSVSDEDTGTSAAPPAVSLSMSPASPKQALHHSRTASAFSIKEADLSKMHNCHRNLNGSPQDISTPNNDEDLVGELENKEEALRGKSSKYTILLGDLNYRVLLSEREAQKKVERKEWDGLLTHDSLSLERRQAAVFNGFEEAVITFPPTFKYEIGSMKFKDRVPSYTDRILYRTSCPTRVIAYTSISDLTMSDHRPVVLLNLVKVQNCVDPEKYEIVMARALKIADEAENNARPKLSVDQQQVTLEGPPLSVQQCKITIFNDGLRPVHWVAENAQQVMEIEADMTSSESSYIGAKASTAELGSEETGLSSLKFDSSFAAGKLPGSIGKNLELGGLKGLRRTPETKSLLSSDTITITPGEGKVSAARPTESLNIVARVGIEPRDFIVLVKMLCGPYRNSKLKGSIEEAVHKYVFVRIVPRKSYLGASMETMPQHNSVPVPIRECVKYLWDRKLSDMFTAPAEPSIFQQVLSCLDENKPLDHQVLDSINPDSYYPVGVFAVAQVLLNMFRYLPDPLMGPNISRKMAAVNKDQKVISLMSQFINHLDLNDDSLDIWAAALYDRTDQKAGILEKRAYLRSMLLCN